ERKQESKAQVAHRGQVNAHTSKEGTEPEFEYLKMLKIEHKDNKVDWLFNRNQVYYIASTNKNRRKIWPVANADQRPAELHAWKAEEGKVRAPAVITTKQVPISLPIILMTEAEPDKIFSNEHSYHLNSMQINSDHTTKVSIRDLRISLWNFQFSNKSINIWDIKPSNVHFLTELITYSHYYPFHCNTFKYEPRNGDLGICNLKNSPGCSRLTFFFKEKEDRSDRNFIRQRISSFSDHNFTNSCKYFMRRHYQTYKTWHTNLGNRPFKTPQRHIYITQKKCAYNSNNCTGDKFKWVWNRSEKKHATGSYTNFFKRFKRQTPQDFTLESKRKNSVPRMTLSPKKICINKKRKKFQLSIDSILFS
uniref:Uncharacterized protein n=1 Tax=Macaca mulatta TaxID=9544 RepID=A0A5F8AIH6_MACMU